MISINLNTARFKLTIEGHAQPEESDQYKEICSAASALAQAMVYAVTRYREGTLLKELDYRPDSGDLMVHMFPEAGDGMEIRRIWELYGYGMELLALSHQQSVTMIRDGKRIREDE